MTVRGPASVSAVLLFAVWACSSSSTGAGKDDGGAAAGNANGGSAGQAATAASAGSNSAAAAAGMTGLGGTSSSNGGDGGSDGDVGASGSPGGDGGGSCLPCSDYAQPQTLGTISESTLDQLSGMAASHKNPGVLFVHNDRDMARFFAVSEQGTLLQTFTIAGASVSDIEDMAIGPCAAGTCLYIADIGDNISPRTDYVILRVEEPVVGTAEPVETMITDFEQLTYSYPDGTHNGESLLIDPASGSLYVISKLDAGMPSIAYRLPAFGADGAAAKVADLTVPTAADQPATAADAHPCGTGFLLRTNDTLYEFRIAPGSAFEQAFFATPGEVPVAVEQQGEAVTYRPDGSGYYTTSEGALPPIDAVSCK
jgi:hypothetical protein